MLSYRMYHIHLAPALNTSEILDMFSFTAPTGFQIWHSNHNSYLCSGKNCHEMKTLNIRKKERTMISFVCQQNNYVTIKCVSNVYS